jgi:hypothetical protein
MTIQVCSDEIFGSRFEICKGCDQYNAEAFDGGGQCMECGCPLQKKLRVKMDACPLGKWGPDMSAETPPPAQLVAAPVPEYTPPTITDMAKSFFSGAAQFVAAGMPRTPLEQLQVRLDTCRACEYWNPDGFGGTGSCRRCGCSTEAKLRMATSECPLGYWQAVPAHSEG